MKPSSNLYKYLYRSFVSVVYEEKIFIVKKLPFYLLIDFSNWIWFGTEMNCYIS